MIQLTEIESRRRNDLLAEQLYRCAECHAPLFFEGFSEISCSCESCDEPPRLVCNGCTESLMREHFGVALQ